MKMHHVRVYKSEETLPREEAQGGREQPGGGSHGDAGAALAQDVRHEGKADFCKDSS